MSETQKSVPIGPPRRHWLKRQFIPRRFHEGIVEAGLVSSGIFAFLFLLLPWAGDYLHPMHKWIGTWYLVSQLCQVLARNSLRATLVLADHTISVVPVLVGFGYTIQYWSPPESLSQESREVLNYWHAVAWIDFAFGIAVANKILGVPYEREQSQSEE